MKLVAVALTVLMANISTSANALKDVPKVGCDDCKVLCSKVVFDVRYESGAIAHPLHVDLTWNEGGNIGLAADILLTDATAPTMPPSLDVCVGANDALHGEMIFTLKSSGLPPYIHRITKPLGAAVVPITIVIPANPPTK